MKQGWTYKKLGEVCDSINGLWKGKKPPYIKVGVIRNANFTKEFTIRYDNIEYLDVEERQYSKRKLQKGDLIIEKSGGGEKTPVGRAVLFNKVDGEFSFSNFTSVLRIKDKKELLSEFLYIYLLFIYKRGDTLRMQKATTGIHNLEFDKYLSIEIPSLPLSEQQRIVERLDSAFTHIDELKANAEKQVNEARALFQKALSKAMEPKDGWEEKTLGEVCNIFGRIGFRGYTTKDLVSSSKDGAISLSPSNIQENGTMDYTKLTYISWFKYEESPEIKIYNGDILLVKTGSSYGKSALVRDLPHEATINPQSVVLKNFKINNKFFAYQLRTDRIRDEFDLFVSGTAIPTFSQAKLSTVKIFMPNNQEQQRIVERLDSLSENVKALEENQRKVMAECDALKQALLRKVFE